MADDKIEFTITWQGASKARLHYVVDNDKVVATEADDLEGHGAITFPYTARHAATHVIEWSLWFPNRTLRKFVAKASVSGAKPATLDSKKEEQKNKWQGRGAAP